MIMELMRRAGLAQGFTSVVERAISSEPNNIELKVILYESELIRLEDNKAHNVDEAMNYEDLFESTISE